MKIGGTLMEPDLTEAICPRCGGSRLTSVGIGDLEHCRIYCND